MRSAVFLDRDGTINEQMGYVNHISRFRMLPGAAEAIALLNLHTIPAVIVTNQSGLARGYFPASLLDAVHEKMRRELIEKNAHVDGIYICPHHPEAKEERYRKNCDCRKPKPGLLLQASAELDLDLEHSYVVGDRWSDISTAATCGAKGLLVLTGYGRGELEYLSAVQNVTASHVAENLLDAVEWIISDMGKR
jgi:D-glycero-D-manno-heptose 1,7-bisphosphate phosphatase